MFVSIALIVLMFVIGAAITDTIVLDHFARMAAPAPVVTTTAYAWSADELAGLRVEYAQYGWRLSRYDNFFDDPMKNIGERKLRYIKATFVK